MNPMGVKEFHNDLCPKGKACQDQACKTLQALLHLDQNVRNDERRRLIPEICERCKMRQELVIDITGRYAHRVHVGAFLHDCHAEAIHVSLVTPAIQIKES